MLKSGDLTSVCTVMRQLRSICNHPSPPSTANLVTPHSVPPTWSRLNPLPARRVQQLVAPDPLTSVSLENLNLVFLKQELTTTGKYDQYNLSLPVVLRRAEYLLN